MSFDIVNLKLSAQRGLIGNVFPKLRAVCVDIKENLIYVCFYIDGNILEEEKECCESTLDNIIADFPLVVEGKETKFETPMIRLDSPQKPPLVGYWVYFRNEEMFRNLD